jgi:hypothetical protein
VTSGNPTGLRRIDDDRTRTHGWQVRIQRRKRAFARHFSDRLHGGKDQAYQAAVDFLHNIERTQPGLLRNEYANIVRKNNTSGVPGVCKYRYRNTEYWVAFWPSDGGKKKQAKFSVAKYGDGKALDLAVAARKRALERLEEPYARRSRKPGVPRRRSTEPGPPPAPDSRIKRAAVQGDRIRVELHDGRVVSVPLSWFPELYKAAPELRQEWTLDESGEALTWKGLGVSVTVSQMLKTT